jgi:hypothetical protein
MEIRPHWICQVLWCQLMLGEFVVDPGRDFHLEFFIQEEIRDATG